MTFERLEFVKGDICDPVSVRDGARELRCGRQLRGRVSRRPLNRRAGPLHPDRRLRHLCAARRGRRAGVERYLQISTDEVYGSIPEGSFTEQSPLDPSSPYSASKAGGDLVVAAYCQTFGVDAVVCRSSNNYGPFQYPEKLIPLCILNALHEDPLPVYGDGMQVRNWLFVTDNCRALDLALREGKPGEVYNVGGPDELPNIDVVRKILELTGRDDSLIEYVKDRLGHDRRYSLSSEKIAGLGWTAEVSFEEGLARTVEWYRDNAWWWEPIRTDEYREYYERQYGQKLRS